jgi:hypothetical protein
MFAEIALRTAVSHEASSGIIAAMIVLFSGS